MRNECSDLWWRLDSFNFCVHFINSIFALWCFHTNRWCFYAFDNLQFRCISKNSNLPQFFYAFPFVARKKFECKTIKICLSKLVDFWLARYKSCEQSIPERSNCCFFFRYLVSGMLKMTNDSMSPNVKYEFMCRLCCRLGCRWIFRVECINWMCAVSKRITKPNAKHWIDSICLWFRASLKQLNTYSIRDSVVLNVSGSSHLILFSLARLSYHTVWVQLVFMLAFCEWQARFNSTR